MPDSEHNNLIVADLGRTRYQSAWDLQKKLVQKRAENRLGDLLLITEHEPVITMGRGSHRENLLVSEDRLKERGVDLHEIERGGDITFHGPGQTVLYPIIDLKPRGRDLHQYLRDMERFVINGVAALGLTATIKPGLTGIWVDDHKIGAIGVAVSKWITYHGVAINVSTDLDYFCLINPCGITEFPVGSISQLLNRDVALDEVNRLLTVAFMNHFGYKEKEIVDPDSLL